MKKLSYETLHEMNYDGYLLEDALNVFFSLEKVTFYVPLQMHLLM